MIKEKIREKDILKELTHYKDLGIEENHNMYKSIAIKYGVTYKDVRKVIACMKVSGRLTETFLKVEEPIKIDKSVKIVKLCKACLSVLQDDGTCFRRCEVKA